MCCYTKSCTLKDCSVNPTDFQSMTDGDILVFLTGYISDNKSLTRGNYITIHLLIVSLIQTIQRLNTNLKIKTHLYRKRTNGIGTVTDKQHSHFT